MRALVAIAHKLLIAAYHVLSGNKPFVDLGAEYLLKRAAPSNTKKLLKKLEALGYKVTLEPV